MRNRLLLSLPFLLPLVGCSEDSAGEGEQDSGYLTGAGETGDSGFAESGGGDSGEASGSDGGSDSGTTGTGADDGGDGDAPGADSGGEDDSGQEPPAPEPGQLTAGEWRDLDDFSFWLDLFEQGSQWLSYRTHWGFHPVHRIPVQVNDSSDQPVVDAIVRLRSGSTTVWESRTDNHGEAETFVGLFDDAPDLPDLQLTVNIGGQSVTVDDVAPTIDDPYLVTVDGSAPTRNELDLMFVIDTTGSMSDELYYLQSELSDVIDRVRNEHESTQMRLSVNFYRDTGDEYVVRDFPFTTNISTGLDQLDQQSSDGGGDYPEAVVEALENAVYEHEWSGQARSRLLFLVFDAPAHSSAADIASLQLSIQAAAAMGIRVIPLACSGVNKETEFLARFMDISTGGTYTFLTNDSGIGNSHIEPTVGPYEVEYLNDLLVRVISESVE